MPDAEEDALPFTIAEDGIHPVTETRRASSLIGKLVPWLLVLCLLCFLGLAAIAVFSTLIRSSAFARATPTPAFLPGTEVRVARPDYGPVTVWQIGAECEPDNAFGEVPSGSEAHILEEACYHRRRKTTYHRIALAHGGRGWVEADDIVPAAEYTPPPPTETPETGPTPTLQPTQTPPPAPLPVGSSLSVGGWAVRVDRVEIADSLLSPAGDKMVTAAGRFAVVFLTATNRGFRPATLHASSVYIEDAEGNRYENDDVASAYASSAGCLDFALDVGPDESVCLVAAVDISAGSSFYVLSLYGANESVILDVP